MNSIRDLLLTLFAGNQVSVAVNFNIEHKTIFFSADHLGTQEDELAAYEETLWMTGDEAPEALCEYAGL